MLFAFDSCFSCFACLCVCFFGGRDFPRASHQPPCKGGLATAKEGVAWNLDGSSKSTLTNRPASSGLGIGCMASSSGYFGLYACAFTERQGGEQKEK